MNEYTDIEYGISIIRVYRVHAFPLFSVSLGKDVFFLFFSGDGKGLNVIANIHIELSREKRPLRVTCVCAAEHLSFHLAPLPHIEALLYVVGWHIQWAKL